ncbi:MAG: hypothetical protein C0395_08590 [Gemmatimonas sp.]|nr:hypothetical protein [Gemmatimonas sp.]
MHRNLRLAALCLILGTAVPAAAWDDFIVLTTDFQSVGGVTRVDRDAPWSSAIDVATISSDAVGRWHDGRYYVVNRSAANIQVLDPAQGMATVLQFSVGVGRNPQDIAFSTDGRAFVSCLDAALLLEVDPVAGGVVGSWSTAGYADADGLPETGWMLAVADRLFITCQRLNRDGWWEPTGPGLLLVFDMSTGTWGAPVTLAGYNPAPPLSLSPDGTRLLAPTVGLYGLLDAGFETVDLATLTSSGLLVTEQQFGGEIVDVIMTGAHRAWAILSSTSFRTSLKTFDPAGGAAPVAVVASNGYDYADLAWDGAQQIYLCDRTTGAAGVRVFHQTSAAELTAAPIPTGRPPFQAVLPLESDATAAPVVAAAAGPALGAPWPNPANPRTTFAAAAAPGEDVAFAVLDLRGRRLREARRTAGADGRAVWEFDGRDRAGRALPSGAYRVTVSGAGEAPGEARLFTLAR